MTVEKAITTLISPDPKIKITQSGGNGTATFEYLGLSQGSPSWTFNGAPYANGSTVNVNSGVDVVVRNGSDVPFLYGDSFWAEPGQRPVQQRLNDQQTTFASSTFTTGNTYHITLDNIPTSDAGSWVYDDSSNSHTLQIRHGLTRVPNLCVVWFSPALVSDMQVLVSWSWIWTNSGNPVTISADSLHVTLEIFYGAPLHGLWKATTPTTGTWTNYSSGYWRVVTQLTNG